MRIISVDPGLTGAIAYTTPTGGSVIDMPIKTMGQQNRIVDTELITSLLMAEWRHYEVIVCERPQWRKLDGAKQVTSTWFNYGRLTAAFPEWCEVMPQTWKRDLGLSGDKSASLEMARNAYPHCVSMLSRAKDHNRAEALLIGLWAQGHFDSLGAGLDG